MMKNMIKAYLSHLILTAISLSLTACSSPTPYTGASYYVGGWPSYSYDSPFYKFQERYERPHYSAANAYSHSAHTACGCDACSKSNRFPIAAKNQSTLKYGTQKEEADKAAARVTTAPNAPPHLRGESERRADLNKPAPSTMEYGAARETMMPGAPEPIPVPKSPIDN